MSFESSIVRANPERLGSDIQDGYQDVGQTGLSFSEEALAEDVENGATYANVNVGQRLPAKQAALVTPQLSEQIEPKPDDFTAIVVEYESLVVRFLCRMLGNREDVYDTAQEAWIKAWRAWDSDKIVDTRRWLIKVAANAARDRLRQRKRVTELLFDITETDGNVFTVEPADSMNIEEAVASRLEVEEVLRRMPYSLRMAIILDVEHLELSQIASVLRLSESNMKMHLARAHRSFKKHLAEVREGQIA